MSTTDNLRTKTLIPLAAPQAIIDKLPGTPDIYAKIAKTRAEIDAILNDDDDRLVVIIGPCSIHDTTAALEYAEKLVKLREKHQNELCIIMRVYFEKPRTTIGWKGLINDPHLDDTFDINAGLELARKLLLDINALGLATGTEFLDTIIPQYIADLISWAAIGARTTESQIHREMTSGLSMPVGFKNGTEGNIGIALDAISAANNPHHFLGVSKDGNAAIISTTGNRSCHVILRGGKQTGPNYERSHVTPINEALAARNLPKKVMVDCSHGNSQKQHKKQLDVLDSICKQLHSSNTIFGVMIESNLVEGNQPLNDKSTLIHGKSITDACIGWKDTEAALELLANTIKTRREDR